MAVHQAPPPLGFSRQEHWNGLPFPSPMHGSEGKLLSHVWLFATPWTVAYQASPPMRFSRQEYWSGLPLPSPSTNLSYNWEFLPFDCLPSACPSQPHPFLVTTNLISSSISFFVFQAELTHNVMLAPVTKLLDLVFLYISKGSPP